MGGPPVLVELCLDHKVFGVSAWCPVDHFISQSSLKQAILLTQGP